MADLNTALGRLKKDKTLKRRARVAQELANVRRKPGLADRVADAVNNQKSPSAMSALDSYVSEPTSITKGRNMKRIRALSGHERK